MAPKPPKRSERPRRGRGAPLIRASLRLGREGASAVVGAPTWPPTPPTFGAARRGRGAPLIRASLRLGRAGATTLSAIVGAPTGPPTPLTFGAAPARPGRSSDPRVSSSGAGGGDDRQR